MGSISKLAPDWLNNREQPIRSLASKLTQLLTMTATHKFPLQESFFDDWIHNLTVQEAVEKPITFPRTPRPSPKVARKVKKLVLDYTCESFFLDWIHNLEVPEVASPPERSFAVTEVDQEDLFSDEKDSRRRDFAKVAKIKDKKRTQAARRSTGKRVK